MGRLVAMLYRLGLEEAAVVFGVQRRTKSPAFFLPRHWFLSRRAISMESPQEI
jgi:hypothetical protein